METSRLESYYKKLASKPRHELSDVEVSRLISANFGGDGDGDVDLDEIDIDNMVDNPGVFGNEDGFKGKPAKNDSTGKDTKKPTDEGNEGNDEPEYTSEQQNILNVYNGSGFDEEGNIVNEEGTIVAKATNSEGVYATLDGSDSDDAGDGSKDGDKPVGKDSKDSKDKEPGDDSFIADLQKKHGYEFKDESGKPKVYEDTEEGLQEYLTDYVDHKVQETQKEFLNTHPELREAFKALQQGKDLRTYYSQNLLDINKVELTKEDTTTQFKVVKQDFIDNGYSEARADALTKMVEKEGKLFEEANTSLSSMRTRRKEAEQEAEAKRLQDIKTQEENTIKHWKAVNDTITSGRVKDIVIPEAERKEFYEYVAIAVDENANSRAMIDQAEEDIETRLAIDYLRFKKFDFGALVREAVREEKAKSIKSKFKKDADKGQSRKPIEQGSLDDLDINNF